MTEMCTYSNSYLEDEFKEPLSCSAPRPESSRVCLGPISLGVTGDGCSLFGNVVEESGDV